MGSWKGRGNQYIQFVRVLYCKLLTNGKQLSAFPLARTESRPQRWEARVLPLCHRGSSIMAFKLQLLIYLIKKVSLTVNNLKNYCPISGLNFMLMVESIVAMMHLLEHIHVNDN